MFVVSKEACCDRTCVEDGKDSEPCPKEGVSLCSGCVHGKQHVLVQVVEVLTDSLTLPETPVPSKAARLLLVSDVLHNRCSLPPLMHASWPAALFHFSLNRQFVSLPACQLALQHVCSLVLMQSFLVAPHQGHAAAVLPLKCPGGRVIHAKCRTLCAQAWS